MAERSFKREVQDLKLGSGDTFTGEGILAITKALLESGVGYVGGYQGAPISHLMDVLADAEDLLSDLGVRYEANASEAAAAAMLAASVHYPIRGAVTFKGAVGVNVASDALANLSSSGVTGGALIIVGEDYGEGSSIMQERSHAFAMKSQFWLLDPRPNLPSIVRAVKHGFALSEASNTPVMLMVRIRSCHVTGQFACEDNVAPPLSVHDALSEPRRDFSRVVLPPMSYIHEQDKVKTRWPAAEAFITEHGLNETFGPQTAPVGIVVQGGMFNGVIRALQRLGLADIEGRSAVPIYVLNVTYPLVQEEFLSFAKGKEALLVVEEGQPEFIEQGLATMLNRARSPVALHGKDIFPMAGEYTGQVMLDSVTQFLRDTAPQLLPGQVRAPNAPPPEIPDLSKTVPIRPPGFCTGCPERPIFAAMKLVEAELGKHQISGDIGCHLFASLPPFEIGGQTMGLWFGTGIQCCL
jgi:indolepyruvate ferredoxin oxidoreductase alpha subunit